MRKSGVLAIATIFIAGLFAFASCDQTTSTQLEESFQKVKEVTPIAGAQNVTMDLSRESQDSYFSVSLNGKNMEGWCIEWNEDSIQGVQTGTEMYSTKGQEAWKELNYFMHYKDKFRAADPELTFREIQVVIWSLIDNPKFDVDKISEYENISERIYKDGQPLFDVQKVKNLVSQVKESVQNKFKTEDDDLWLPGLSFVKNDGQTVMVAGETAFAYNPDYSTCFDEEILEDISFPRWGWTNGPISPGSGDISFDIYAGAGKCDLSKGTKVGELTANYGTDGTLTVTYTMTATSAFTDELYTMATAHLYAGTDPYPTNGGSYTVAPGQYTVVDDPIKPMATEKTYTIEDLSGDIYFIAHTDVYGFDPDA